MRFHEFAPPAQPVLKISQQQQAGQIELRSNASPTPFPTDQKPKPAPVSVKIYPKQWQRDWIQKYLAARMARAAQTVTPTEIDIIRAQVQYANAQRRADQAFAERNGEEDPETGWQGEHRWVKRD